MVITVASGKGGTGKTTFAVSLAWVLSQQGEKVRLLDCDVEEPNDHLFIPGERINRRSVTVRKPTWNAEKCTACGKCVRACRYNAMALVKKKVLIFNELCHACGACSAVCPEDALPEQDVEIGKIREKKTKLPFFFADGELGIGESLAPAVVKAVRRLIDASAINILDASPGAACPVVAAVEGSDIVVLVTEPTPFGLNDLKMALRLSLQLGVPTGIVINRSRGEDDIIENYAREYNIPILGRIPFRREYAEAYSRGEILAKVFPELGPGLLNIFYKARDLEGEPVPAPPPEDDILPPDEENIPFPAGQSNYNREVVVISGKGGTGKTTLLSSFAVLSDQHVLADNDVDAADLHLLLTPRVRQTENFAGGAKAVIDSETCIDCARCFRSCRFDAIDINGAAPSPSNAAYRVKTEACEGCGLCAIVCPVKAIHMEEHTTGQAYESWTAHGPMAHARLGIAEENSGKLVTHVRTLASRMARDLAYPLILADGPPGTSCPVIASITGVDAVLIVTEPTVSGVHDSKRVLTLTQHFRVPALVVINKADLNTEQASQIEQLAKEGNATVVGHIPFDREVHEALMEGKCLPETSKGPAALAIQEIWKKVQNLLEGEKP